MTDTSQIATGNANNYVSNFQYTGGASASAASAYNHSNSGYSARAQLERQGSRNNPVIGQPMGIGSGGQGTHGTVLSTRPALGQYS